MIKKILCVLCVLISARVCFHYYQLYSQTIDIVMKIDDYIDKKGGFPKEISSVFGQEYTIQDEMFQFNGIKFKFFYGYNDYANGYILVVDQWYMPNVIYFFNERRIEFNSNLYSARGL